jgi:hypothetical protein
MKRADRLLENSPGKHMQSGGILYSPHFEYTVLPL